jgi:predicted GNAT family acetyltransferase
LISVRSTGDPAAALAEAGEFLMRQPVHNSIMLTLLHSRVDDGVAGRYWVATDGGEVVGFAFQSPLHFRAVVAPADRAVIQAIADVMAEEAPAVPGVMSVAASAAVFAGRWAEVRRTPVFPAEGQRLFRLGQLVQPVGVPGRLRVAHHGERSLLVAWAGQFVADIGERPPFATEEMVGRRIAAGLLWVWDDGGAVSMAVAPPPVAGVCRIGFVYTPPEYRRRGYAGACVAALSGHLLAAGAEVCALYTQLANPTSNAIYRRIGYEPVDEILIYRFTS